MVRYGEVQIVCYALVDNESMDSCIPPL
jgi:hypothetical protein